MSKLRWMVFVSAVFSAGVFASRAPVLRVSPQYSGTPTSTTGLTSKSVATGCSCHGSATVAITPTITGPSQLFAGDYGTYQINGSKTGLSQATTFGFDVSASDNAQVLATESGEPETAVAVGNNANNTEITHNVNVGALRQTNTATNYYKFRFNMPANAADNASHTVYGVIGGINIGGWNAASNFTITTKPRPAAPTTLTPGTPGSGSVPLSWSGGAGPKYRVMYKTGSYPANSGDGTIGFDGTNTSATVGNLTPSTQYFFSVFSEDTGVTSGNAFFSTGAAQATATTAAAQATNWYVNVGTGADTNNGTSSGTPFKTIGHANQVALSGDTINVAAGTYTYAPPPC